MTNIEQLRKETDEITNSLKELKENLTLSEEEKKKEAEKLKNQAEVTKQKVENEIKTLESATDNGSKKQKEEAEALLNSFSEITSLYGSIVNTGTTETPSGVGAVDAEKDKNIFTRGKEWVVGQWDDVWNKEKWKTEGGRNLLRTAGFVATGVGGVALAYKGIKSLWNRAFGDDEKKGETETKESETKTKESEAETENSDTETKESETNQKQEGQSFRKTGWGQFLKRAGITTTTGGVIYGISKLGGKKEPQTENIQESGESIQEGGDTISDDMFKQLLEIEGSQNFTAKTHKQKFGENFATGPYGMVYKHIDKNGNLLDKPIPFEDGEHVSKEWAEKNARALYNKRAKERKDLLDSKGYSYNQNMLDALVSTCGGTTKSRNNCKNYVLSHRNDKDDVANFISKHATTAAGNGQTMPGLVRRRKFEANWFIGNKQPFRSYKA